MLKSKSVLGVDFGAGTLKIGEFAPAEVGGLSLVQFGIKSLGLAGSQDAARDTVLKKALADLLVEGGFSSRQANLCAPGYQVFSKFVKLPPVDSSKVTQIIQYEAQQNVPFPLAETAWDYQILGTSPSGELEVLLLAIKSDAVEKLFAVAEGDGLKMDVVDGSVAALCNAFRYNYADLEGCSLLIDIGAKTSGVLLFEKNKFYARGINVGANSITQEFAAEVKLPFAEAEKLKVTEGFVSLGGAYEEPDNPRVAAVSKVARNVLTRLHLQVNQTIQFYKTQQGGALPDRVFLCGGGSIMPYAVEFFQEKLDLPVELFNPFRSVQIDPAVNVGELENVAQCFGEVVGLGLRSVVQCPVELNLMPKSSKTRQEFNAKKPYLLAAAYALVVGVFAYGWFYGRVSAAREEGLNQIAVQVDPLAGREQRLQIEEGKLRTLSGETSQLTEWMADRAYWAEILLERQRTLKVTEDATRAKLGAPAISVWIETLKSTEVAAPAVSPAEESTETAQQASPYMLDPVLAKRYGLVPTGASAEGAPATPSRSTKSASKKSGATNEISTIDITVRAVNLSGFRPNANSELAYDLERELKASPLFDESETLLSGSLDVVDENSPSFSFPVKVTLRRSIKN